VGPSGVDSSWKFWAQMRSLGAELQTRRAECRDGVLGEGTTSPSPPAKRCEGALSAPLERTAAVGPCGIMSRNKMTWDNWPAYMQISLYANSSRHFYRTAYACNRNGCFHLLFVSCVFTFDTFFHFCKWTVSMYVVYVHPSIPLTLIDRMCKLTDCHPLPLANSGQFL